MSATLHQVLYRSNDDANFRRALLNKDDNVLVGYGLTEEEICALISGDENMIYRLRGNTHYFHIREQGNYCSDEE